MRVIISCDDIYEAQKLASLIFIRGDDVGETYITGILDVIDNEVIVSLKDESAHSILLNSHDDVEMFVDFMQSVIDGEHTLISTKTLKRRVEISKE